MNNKYIKIILIIAIILLLCTTIVLLINPNKKNTNNPSQNEEELSEDIIIPKNTYAFFGKYENGEVTNKEIYKKINFFANVTVKKYAKLADLSNEQLEEYYNKNSKEIINDDYIAVNNKKEFVEFIHTIALIKENDKIETMVFDKNDIDKNKKSTIAKLNFQYSNNRQISLYVKVNLKKSNDTQNIVFSLNKTN